MINLFTEGSLISAKALFCLRALFRAMLIHSYTRMTSLIRTWLSDLFTRQEVINIIIVIIIIILYCNNNNTNPF